MRHPGYKYILAFLDWVTINLSFVLTLFVVGRTPFALSDQTYVIVLPELLSFAVYAIAVIGMFQHQNLYKINVFLSRADQIVKITVALIYSVVGLVLLSFFTKSSFVTESRLIVSLYLGVALVLLVVVRVIVFRSVFKLVSRTSLYRRNILIVGAGQTAKMLAANLNLNDSYGIRIVGFVDNELPRETVAFMGSRVIGELDDIHTIVKKHRIAEVFIALDNVTHDRLLEITDMFKNRRPHVKIVSSLYDIIPARLFTERYGDVPVTSILSHNGTLTQYYVKRVFDVLLTLCGLIALAPVLLLVAIAIKLDSKGPILFRQTRIGKKGKPFKFFKFRSMYSGSERDEERENKVAKFIRRKSVIGRSTKIVEEESITRVGRFIRGTSIDELPQLFNVLKGDMSLVGPRPCLPYEWENYENWHKRRLSVIPGCTGLWQVNGRSEVGFEDMVILDLYYINNRSFLLDLQIILKTFPVMIFARGAK